jgi:hypothetical protein
MLSFESLVKIIVLSKWKNNFKIDGLDKSKRCIIIGNGPSFKQSIETHRDLLIGNDTLCVNSFATSEYLEVLKPKYYVLHSKILFISRDEMPERYKKLQTSIFEALQRKVTWEIYLMVPFGAKKSIEFRELLAQNKKIIPLYFNITGLEGFDFFKHTLFTAKLGMPRPHNVLIPAIMNMIHLKYEEIHIIGADHSWLEEITVNEDNNALVHQKHFYDEDTSKSRKMMDYIKRPRMLHEIIHKFYLSFKGYWEIKDYAIKKNVKIYNSSENSMIDAFERKKLSDI